MEIKKLFVFAILLFGFVFLVSTALADSVISSPSVCCAKTLSGGYCINTNASSCDPSAEQTPTSCESTSYCQLGTCYNSKEGLCLENVPQRVCQTSNGTWSNQPASVLPQCQLGCCVLSDQAALVTLTKCKSLSTFYGLTTDFRSQINTETDCIATANSQDEGACVSYDSGVKTCSFTTRAQCGGIDSAVTMNISPLGDTSGKYFYKGVLCSADELGTECARQTSTECFEGKVYYVDSCGNKENVYSSNSDASWNNGRVADPSSVCPIVGDSKTCGNCDYQSGSRCAPWDTTFLGIGKPSNVDDYCKTTKCTDSNGNTRLNGESWCIYDSQIGNGKAPPGSESFREVCVDGTVQVEQCDSYRNQICMHSGIQTSAGQYSVAACRVNRWQDCTAQTSKDDCENTDQRDCLWVAAVQGINFNQITTSSNTLTNPTASSTFTNPTAASTSTASSLTTGVSALSSVASTVTAFTGKVVAPVTGEAIQHILGAGVGQWEGNTLGNTLRTNETATENGACVPLVPPGIQFWAGGNSQPTCGIASATCTVTVTKTYDKSGSGLITGQQRLASVEISPKNTTCLIQDGSGNGKSITFSPNVSWAVQANAMCNSMGDCGAEANINNVFTDEGYEWKYLNNSYFFTQSDIASIQRASLGTGQAVSEDYIINNQYQLNQNDYVYVKQ